MNTALASHYASALADAVFSSDSDLAPQDAVEQLRTVASLLLACRQLQVILPSPAVRKDQKSALVDQLAGEFALHRTLRNFMLLVVLHRRTGELKRILADFEQLVDERLGFVPAEIYSARELSAEERGKIERALSDRLGKAVRARYKVDSSVLGGVKASVDSKEYDATIRGQLERLRTHLFANL